MIQKGTCNNNIAQIVRITRVIEKFRKIIRYYYDKILILSVEERIEKKLDIF